MTYHQQLLASSLAVKGDPVTQSCRWEDTCVPCVAFSEVKEECLEGDLCDVVWLRPHGEAQSRPWIHTNAGDHVLSCLFKYGA